MENYQEITDFKVSDWVVVQYDNQNYPGEISDVMDEEIVVSAIHPASGKRIQANSTVFCMRFCHFQLDF